MLSKARQMHCTPLIGGIIFSSVAFAASFNPCPLLGPVYPAPTSLPSSPIIQSALSNLTDALNTFVATGNSSNGPYPPANITTWSIGMFSTSDNTPDPFWQWHYTDPTVANSTAGVHKADIDSVYRIGSISKLFTVYSLLIEAGDGYWQEPVTKYVPELAAIAQGDPKEGVEDVTRIRWEDITLGDLANQLASLPRDFSAEIETQLPSNVNPVDVGFPPLNASETPQCSLNAACNRTAFLDIYKTRYPTFLPSTTPGYSNDGFSILAFAIEGITNKTIDQIYQDSIYTPLNMTRSSLRTAPDASLGVIPLGLNGSGWTIDDNVSAPAGAMYSSLRDMTAAGRSMLNSTLMSPAITRRWLKPGTHTDSLYGSVGKPWEIARNTINGRVVDAYTKSGNIGYWGSFIVLVPDFQFGFTILGASGPNTAAPQGGVLPELVGSIIADKFFPALEQAAKQQGTDAFTGVYNATGLNSSLVLEADDLPGLNIASLISNGSDIIGELAAEGGEGELSSRVYPTNLHSKAADGSSRFAFQILWLPSAPSTMHGWFNIDCTTWFGVDTEDYGEWPLQELVFDLDCEGKVVAAENPALRVRMEKTA